MENNKRKNQSDVMLEAPLKYYAISTYYEVWSLQR